MTVMGREGAERGEERSKSIEDRFSGRTFLEVFQYGDSRFTSHSIRLLKWGGCELEKMTWTDRNQVFW